LSTIEDLFKTTVLQIFENPLTFDTAEPFLAYTRASLSEDRKLWTGLFKGSEEFEQVMEQIQGIAEARLKQDGKLVMTKVVGGIVATK
jgi:hypothetical protein